MNRTEHLLVCAAEECAEIAQRIDKALRFSLGEVQDGQKHTNAERIAHEFLDLLAVMEMLHDDGVLRGFDLSDQESQVRIGAKRARVEKYMALARRHGALEDTDAIKRALVRCREAMEHAMAIGHCGEGSTRGMFVEAVNEADRAVGDRG